MSDCYENITRKIIDTPFSSEWQNAQFTNFNLLRDLLDKGRGRGLQCSGLKSLATVLTAEIIALNNTTFTHGALFKRS